MGHREPRVFDHAAKVCDPSGIRLRGTKAHPAYTTAIGEDCRIIAPAEPPPTPKPVLTGDAETAYAVRITFTMSGHDQIEIWRKRGAEVDFTLLTVDTNSPFVDTSAPLVPNTPESRQYRARYVDNDLPVGDWSDVISVTAQA